MNTMPDTLIGWLSVINILWMLGLSIFIVVRKPGEEAKQALATLAQRVGEIDAHLQHMPSGRELSNINGEVRAMNERTAALANSMDTMRAQLNRIETFLLNNRT